MYNLTMNEINPSHGFILVRHGQDDDVLTTDLDQVLIPDSYEQINKFALYVKGKVLEETTFTIVHGPSKRTSQTARFLAKVLGQKNIFDIKEDIDIKEFNQGRFIVDKTLIANGKYLPLEKAWEIFNGRTLNGDTQYRFGDPLVNAMGKPTYPILGDFFDAYGETQSEFLFRIRRFISNIWNVNRLLKHLCVVITHQAVASRIQREILGRRVQLGYCEGVFVPYLNRP